MSDALDALTLPLSGSRLIEASAGTGKTWTIAALYLRLVLGHGDDAAFVRPLAPAEILVLTFTRAATRELSDRIRQRLLQAARVFRGDEAPPDPLLADLLASYPEGTARATAAWRLGTAAESMDDAAVFTIDAWCQRMLREHAFDSGSLFDEELVPDDGELRREAVRDYWRRNVYGLAPQQLAALLSVWEGVGALEGDMRRLMAFPVDADAGREPLGALLDRLSGDYATRLASVQAALPTLRLWLEAGLEQKCFNGTKVQKRYVDAALDALAAGGASPDALRKAMGSHVERLTPDFLHASWKAAQPIAVPAVCDEIATLLALPGWGPAVRRHAAAQVAARLLVLKDQSRRYGFQDMLDRLDAALVGPNGDRLRERIVAQYPVALVDEFQDTSPVQYRIFDALYRTATNDPQSALLLIGDPKQSIYGFRGADIHSYLSARRATEGRHHMLDTNHRSTGGLVAAVNHLFERAEARAGEGAFLLRRGADDPMPFQAVKARGRAEHFGTARGEVPAVTFAVDPVLQTVRPAMRRLAAACAERIVTWLDDPAAGFDDGRAPMRRLRPADIAVLVSSRHEAEAVRRELRHRRVASVYLSDRDSVFASPEAADLQHWLRAVVSPLDARLVRAGFATRLLARSLGELAVLADDDTRFERETEALRGLHRAWLGQGVLTMLRQTLHLYDLPARWLAEPDGERRLTNLLHLAELLQNASARLDNEHALVRWLAERVQDDSETADEQIVRLESDADLVQVITVHKSKGLEYPVVLLPFATMVSTRVAPRLPALSVADADGRRTLHLAVDAEVTAAADRERLQEDLRLLYVALTRARHALWVGVTPVRGRGADCLAHRSGLGRLLVGEGPATAEGLVAAVDALASGHAEMAAEVLPERIERTLLSPASASGALVAAPAYAGRFDRRWAIASFTALVRHLGAAPLPALTGVVREDEVLASDEPADALKAPAELAAWHAFPRGALAGNFLHDQLEWLAEDQFALATSETLRERLRRRCDRQGWGHRADDVLAWLVDVVSRPMPPVGAALDALAHRLPEMEFWFPSDDLPTAEVDALCQAHLLDGEPRPALPDRELRGMLMGFADLVFFHGGRYWVLDYKSNALGTRDSDYSAAAIRASMAEHRYDVQAALYLLALHRLLKVRLGASYDPASHLGGAVYVYLRGIHGPAGGCCHLAAAPELLDALDAAFGSNP